MRTIPVALTNHHYEIVVDQALLAKFGELVWPQIKGQQIVIITDQHVGRLYGSIVQASFDTFTDQVYVLTLEAGEKSKSFAQVEAICSQLLAWQIHRDASIIAVGGGVVGDVAGFVAAIYQRGIQFFQVPTSLLAQIDSSIGGKVAINHPLGKNMIGAFYQPQGVWVDRTCLQTLPVAEFINGMAEVIKYGMIYTGDFLSYLAEHCNAVLQQQPDQIDEVITYCCQVKAAIVGEDEKESGLRAVLNFGHTFGHGIEWAGGYQHYRHGEALSIGMLLATAYASAQGLCSESLFERLHTLLSSYGLPTTIDPRITPEKIVEGMLLDKKNNDQGITLILPLAAGVVQPYHGVQPESLLAFLQKQKEVPYVASNSWGNNH